MSSDDACIARPDELIVVTGANGFIGSKVVEALLQYGFTNIRCFVRPSSRLDRLEPVRRGPGQGRTHLIVGDLTSTDDCARAAAGASLIFHLAASFSKSFEAAVSNSVVATRNLIEAAIRHGNLKRLTLVSSLSVYSNRALRRGALLDESAPLEDDAALRHDAYAFGKLKQEELVREYGRTHGLPYVILRPGTVFGPGKKELTGRVGLSLRGVLLHVGGSNLLPLTYVDNCADAIVTTGLRAGVDGQVFNVVDDELLTSAEFLRAYAQRTGVRAVSVPYWTAYAIGALWEQCSRLSLGKLPPVLNRRRCSTEWKGNRFTNQRLHEHVGWSPRVGMHAAMEQYLNQFHQR